MAHECDAPPAQAAADASHANGRTIDVFVHLAYDKDVDAWRTARAAGRLVGINDETPYGYARAEAMGCRVTFSRSAPEGPLARFVRLGVRAVLGFDLLHAWRQREAFLRSEIVWTHTESQYLAVAALLLVTRQVLVTRQARSRPLLLGQSVWLFDRWPSLPFYQRWLFRWLIGSVDILTTHSNDNLAIARRLFPDKRLALVPFGIPSEAVTPPGTRSARPVRILAPGSDRHRDWETLVRALDGLEDASLLILSGTAPRHLARGRPRVRIATATSQTEFVAHLAEATLVCVPLSRNAHASGITVIQEAVLAGVPVVATDTGGLTHYFDRDAVRYVPPGDVDAMRGAIAALARDPDGARAMAERAQMPMTEGRLGADAFIRRHVEISRTLLNR